DNVDFEALRITPAQVARLESEIDGLNEKLQPLDSFVLPGGSEAAAHLHLARTLMRRAERRLSAAMEGGEGFSESARQFINRASDLLFVAARAANGNGENDVKWVPGANRD
ncbi:MAG TPA: ATP:cob(I)alamin adenosyltransferase, partial [Rhodobiaceae bacterium]|nr:ATP:cob(I)alamin adenosyltransferase [Rhodobiaceae bacterium]